MMLYIRGSLHYIDVIHVYGHEDGQTAASRTSKGVETQKIVGDIRSIVDTVKQWPTTAIADISDF
ncbi:hypothetical protein BBK82_09160 [Lentzea guizhouensis]|uniref:Uncharacterized protein n=2 Tax=Lentzea guizhouensis TaxID=1586287 RepID=A0A1B2HEQ3_9PSEU|nr:hypothetical protein BBK82_09160 [Lentzea guizhouensis]